MVDRMLLFCNLPAAVEAAYCTPGISLAVCAHLGHAGTGTYTSAHLTYLVMLCLQATTHFPPGDWLASDWLFTLLPG
ncbi:hypothetical protein HYQ46_002207 [Verticillium longisporum]|nr:hypothetical protein HYQ46_002207 [Verticillium longisporum]